MKQKRVISFILAMMTVFTTVFGDVNLSMAANKTETVGEYKFTYDEDSTLLIHMVSQGADPEGKPRPDLKVIDNKISIVSDASNEASTEENIKKYFTDNNQKPVIEQNNLFQFKVTKATDNTDTTLTDELSITVTVPANVKKKLLGDTYLKLYLYEYKSDGTITDPTPVAMSSDKSTFKIDIQRGITYGFALGNSFMAGTQNVDAAGGTYKFDYEGSKEVPADTTLAITKKSVPTPEQLKEKLISNESNQLPANTTFLYHDSFSFEYRNGNGAVIPSDEVPGKTAVTVTLPDEVKNEIKDNKETLKIDTDVLVYKYINEIPRVISDSEYTYDPTTGTLKFDTEKGYGNYGIAVVNKVSGNDGIYDYIRYNHSGEKKLIKTEYTYDLALKIDWVDTVNTYRPNSLTVVVYGGEQTGDINNKADYIQKYVIDITEKRNVDPYTIEPSLKVPIYINYETRRNAEDGDGTWQTEEGFYKVKVVAPTGYKNEDQKVALSKDENNLKWYKSDVTSVNTLQDLVSPKFTLNWCDNRNIVNARPFSNASEVIAAPDKWSDYFDLWFKYDDDKYMKVSNHSSLFFDSMSLEPTVKLTGPGTWEVQFSALPRSVDGKNVTYFCAVKDTLIEEGSKPSTAGAESDHTYSIENGLEVQEVLTFHDVYDAILAKEGTPLNMIYQHDFVGSLKWNDGSEKDSFRPENASAFAITLKKGETTVDSFDPSTIQWTNTDQDVWNFRIKNLDLYTTGNSEIIYNISLGEITSKDGGHKYVISYNNVPNSTDTSKGLNGGKLYATLTADAKDFKVTKHWMDDLEDDTKKKEIRGKEITEKGLTLYLWRYPKKGSNTVDNGAAVTKNGTQLSYALKGDEDWRDEVSLTLESFSSDSLPKYSEEGYEYIYYVTEESNSLLYKTVYYNEGGTNKAALNGGEIRNVQTKMLNIPVTKRWMTASANHYVGSKVTVKLQEWKKDAQGNDAWVDVDGIAPIVIEGFSLGVKSKTGYFDAVDIYNDEGKRRQFRVLETKVEEQNGPTITFEDSSYSLLDQDDPTYHRSNYSIENIHYWANTKMKDSTEGYPMSELTNEMASEIEYQVIIKWLGGLDTWEEYTNDGQNMHQGTGDKVINTEIELLQDGKPYGVIRTKDVATTDLYGGLYPTGVDDYNNLKVADLYLYNSSDEVESNPTVSNLKIQLQQFASGSTTYAQWVIDPIHLPALQGNGSPHVYTVSEKKIEQKKDDVKYKFNGEELTEANKIPDEAKYYTLYEYYAPDASKPTAYIQNYVATVLTDPYTVIDVLKLWNDDSTTTYRTSVIAVVVSVNADGNGYMVPIIKTTKEDGGVDEVEFIPADVFKEGWKNKTYTYDQLLYKVTLSEGNNWYKNIHITHKYMVPAGSNEQPRWSVLEIIGDQVIDIDTSGGLDFSQPIKGTIEARADASGNLSQMGFNVEITASDGTINKSNRTYQGKLFTISNTRVGQVELEIDKKWADGKNKRNTRQDELIFKVEQFLNGLSTGKTYIVTKDTTSTDQEDGYNLSVSALVSEVIPAFDEHGVAYSYVVQEFLKKGSEETEINPSDTDKTTKTGYVQNLVERAKSGVKTVSGKEVFNEKITFDYTNSLLGLRTDEAEFYQIWNDKYYYENNMRPDVSYTLYYSLDEGQTIKPYDGNGLPEYSMTVKTADTDGKENPYFQKIGFKGLPNGTYVDGVYHLYDYYLKEEYTGNAEVYKNVLYNQTGSGNTTKKTEDVVTVAGQTVNFYDKEDANVSESTNGFINEKGLNVSSIQEQIKIKGNKIWQNTEGVPANMLPQAEVYLWRESDYDKKNKMPNPGSIDTPEAIKNNVNYKSDSEKGYVSLNDARTGYDFSSLGEENHTYDKYDKYGAIYTYSVSEIIVANDGSGTRLPLFVMKGASELLSMTNEYVASGVYNKRKIEITKNWDLSGWNAAWMGGKTPKEYNATAQFRLWQYEYPDVVAYDQGPDVDLSDASKIPLKDSGVPDGAVLYRPVGSTNENYSLQTVSIQDATGDGTTVTQKVEWSDLPIYSPSGRPYVYFVEELTGHGMDSFTITNDAIDDSTGHTGTTPVNRKINARIVAITNYGINPSTVYAAHHTDPEYDPNFTTEESYTNKYKSDTFTVIKGGKTWAGDSLFETKVRPNVATVDSQANTTADDNTHISLELYRMADSQSVVNNGVSSKETIDPGTYTVKWTESGDNDNQWQFVITMNDDNKLPIYAPNGKPYRYYVRETLGKNSSTGKNYTGTTLVVNNLASNAKTDENNANAMTLSLGNLKNTLKGSVTVQKKWDDYNNEYGLRSNIIRGVLQYRIVTPEAAANSAGSEGDWTNYTYKNNGESTADIELKYSEEKNNNWRKTIANLPITTQDGSGIYQYRFVEYYLLDYGVVDSIDYTTTIPNNYLTSSNKTDEGGLKVRLQGNHQITEPAPAVLTSTDSKTTLLVVNKLLDESTTSINIVKTWDDENDCTGVRPKSISFVVQSRYQIPGISPIQYSEWKNVQKTDVGAGSGDLILNVTSDYKQDDGSWKVTYSHLPSKGPGDTDSFVTYEYRAIEIGTNLGRYEGYDATNPQKPMKGQPDNTGAASGESGVIGYESKYVESDGKYVTSLQNKLSTRSLTVEKKWNDNNPNHAEEVTIALMSGNFVGNETAVTEVPGTERVLKVGTDYTTTYQKLPMRNEKGALIEYYVVEKKIGEDVLTESGYDLDVYYTGAVDVNDGNLYSKAEVTLNTTAGYGSAKVDQISGTTEVPATKVILVNTPCTSLNVKKSWVDENNRHNLRGSVGVTLYYATDGVKGDKVTKDAYGVELTANPESLTKVDGNAITWNNLKAYKDVETSNVVSFATGQGVSQEYLVEENTFSGYTTTYLTSDSMSVTDQYTKATDGNTTGLICLDPTKISTETDLKNLVTVTNTYVPEKGTVSADKIWVDNSNLYGTRPDSMYLSLYYRVGTTGDWTLIGHKDDISGYADGGIYTTSAVTQEITKAQAGTGTNADKWIHTETAGTWKNLPEKKLVTSGSTDTATDVYYKVFETAQTPAATITATAAYASKVSGYTASTSATDGDKITSATPPVNQNITNTLNRINIAVEKQWTDETETATDAARPQKIVFGVEYRHGASGWQTLKDPTDPSKDYELTLEGTTSTWTGTIANLPKLDSADKTYEYRLKEKRIIYNDTTIGSNGVVEVTGNFDTTDIKKWVGTAGPYEATVTIVSTTPAAGADYSYKVTATNKLVLSSLTVTKTWNDEANRDGKRPATITVQLYRDGKTYGSPVTITSPADSSTLTKTYTWDNLPKYRNGATAHNDSNLSEYYVVETAVTDYETKYGITATATQSVAEQNKVTLSQTTNNIYIANNYTPVRISIKATKTWADSSNKYQVRPTSAKLKLQYKLDGETEWNDVSNVAGTQYLDATGIKVETTSSVEQTVTKQPTDSADKWSILGWDNLPAYAKNTTGESKKITYRVQEVDVDSHYTSNDSAASAQHAYAGETSSVTIDITNTIKGSEYTYTVTKKWDDALSYNKFKVMPEKVHVHLEYSTDNGSTWKKFTGTTYDYDLLSSDNWSHTFTGLNSSYKYRAVEDYLIYMDENNQEQKVEVVPSAVGALDGIVGNFSYNSEDKTASDATTGTGEITNTIPDKTLTITKAWDDENNRDHLRPTEVVVKLNRDGVLIEEVHLNEANSWTVTYNHLPMYQNGKAAVAGNESTYSVEEDTIPEYAAEYSIDAGAEHPNCEWKFTADTTAETKAVKIRNIHATDKINVYADEIWVDSHNKCGSRPEKVYVTLLYRVGTDGAWKVVNAFDKATYDAAGMIYPDTKVHTTSPATQEIVVSAVNNEADAEEFLEKGVWKDLPLKGTEDGIGEVHPVYYMMVQTDVDPATDPSLDLTLVHAPKGYHLTNSDVIKPEPDSDHHGKLRNELISTSLTVTKKWLNDEDNRFITRPDSITLVLQRRVKVAEGVTPNEWKAVTKDTTGLFPNTTPVSISVTPDADGQWVGTFDLLPVYDADGIEMFEYRAVETELVYGDTKVKLFGKDEQNLVTDVLGASYESHAREFSAPVEGKPYEVYTEAVTNKLQTTSVTVAKLWDDQENQWNTRPTAIRMVVERRAKSIATDILTSLGADTGWETVLYNADGEKKPLTITLQGKEFADVTVEGLPVYDSKNRLYEYRVREETLIYPAGEILISDTHAPYEVVKNRDDILEPLDNGTPQVNKPKVFRTEITNKLKVVDVKLIKQWEDEEDAYGMRPEDIPLAISNQNGKLSVPLEMIWNKGKAEWTLELKELPRYLAGTTTPVQYIFTEGEVEHYKNDNPKVTVENGKATLINEFTDYPDDEEEGALPIGRIDSGDHTPLGLWFAMLLISVMTMFTIIFSENFHKKKVLEEMQDSKEE